MGECGKKIERRTDMYFTGDTHFCHKNIIRYCNRPFTNMDEMNRFIINEWNKTVGEKDIIYHLGDFAWRNLKAAEEILKQLKGRKEVSLHRLS